MSQLTGKVAVVTGGTRGLGFAIAAALAEQGAAVVVASRSAASVEEAVKRLRALGARADGLAVDVTSLSQVEALAEYTQRQFGRVDIWVNNAGTAGPYGPTPDLEPEAFLKVIETNIHGVYYGSRTAVRLFVAQGSGKLINLLGHGYRAPVPYQNAYASSKAWVRSFTMALAAETRDSGVGVFAYNPGMVLTDLLTHVEVVAGSEERLRRFPTVVRLLSREPDQPARKVAWLASPATDGKTGLLVNNFSVGFILARALQEGLRMVLRRPAPSLAINISSIPPAGYSSSQGGRHA